MICFSKNVQSINESHSPGMENAVFSVQTLILANRLIGNAPPIEIPLNRAMCKVELC